MIVRTDRSPMARPSLAPLGCLLTLLGCLLLWPGCDEGPNRRSERDSALPDAAPHRDGQAPQADSGQGGDGPIPTPTPTPTSDASPKLDGGARPKLDSGAPPKLDGGAPPKLDGGAPPKLDSGAAAPVQGIWTSAKELAGKPTSGDAYKTLKSFADGDTSKPDVSNQDDPTNVRVLAAAIVYARTNNAAYKSKVIKACQQVIGTEKGGRTLAWGREAGAYALAADLVGYKTAAFSAWLKTVTDGAKGSQTKLTLRQMFYKRPNNWGSMALGSLAAIYAYLGDKKLLADVRGYWIKGVVGPDPGLKYGSDLSWHPDPKSPKIINPKGAIKSGVKIDGIIPDDMRRGGSFTTGTPASTGYPWEHLQGVLMAARIFERAGLPIWSAGDQAIYRAAFALQVRFKGSFLAAGDDLWQLPFLDAVYGTSWAGKQKVWGAGKNVGFAYVLP